MSDLSPLPIHPDAEHAPRTPEGMRLYAIGDVHGRHDCLIDLLAKIDADRAAHPIRETQEVFLGDYVDRGPDSAGVISTLIARSARPGVVCLPGNHDRDFLAALNGEIEFARWAVVMGGLATARSYGLAFPVGDIPVDGASRLRAAMPAAHLAFLEELAAAPPQVLVGDMLFVHAGLRPGVPLAAQSREDMLTIRKPFLIDPGWHGALIVHGHSPGPEPVVLPNRIGVDTMAFASGRLTCAVLEAGGVRFLHGVGPENRAFGRLKPSAAPSSAAPAAAG